MTRQFPTTITTLIIATGFILAASVAIGQVTMQFPAIKDIQIQGFFSEQLISRGDKDKMRPSKLDEDVTLMDFDTAAMEAFLDANPGTASWTMNIVPSFGTFVPSGIDEMTIMTVESTNDWAESVGTSGSPLGWSVGTPAATYFYAQTSFTIVEGLRVLDTANSLEWIDPDSGPYTFTPAFPNYAGNSVPDGVGGGGANPTPAFTNSATWDWAELAVAQDLEEFASLAIDDVIIDALIHDENNRGLRFGPLVSMNSAGWRIFAQSFDNGLFAPHLEVTVIPDANTPGDFDTDGDVDGNDFLVWQRDMSVGNLADWQMNFGDVSASAAASAVPEPSALLLLLAASSALTCIRGGNRQTV